jgi:hypothetical protein
MQASMWTNVGKFNLRQRTMLLQKSRNHQQRLPGLPITSQPDYHHSSSFGRAQFTCPSALGGWNR